MSKKKGISIGESLRGRMTSTPAESLTVSTESVEQHAPVEEEPTLAPQPSTVATPQAIPPDPLESFNTRLRQSTHRRLKVYSAVHNVKIQDAVNEALVAYLESKEG